MKKSVRIFIKLSVCLLICLVCVSLYSLLRTYYVTKDFTADKLVENMLRETDVKEYSFDIKEAISELPVKIQRIIYSEDVKVKINKDNSQYGSYGYLAGKYYYKNQTILLNEEYQDESLFLHEIGHVFSYNTLPLIKISDTKELKKIYKEEKDIIFPDGQVMSLKSFSIKNEYMKSSEEEFFAACLVLYLKNELLEKYKIYNFINKTLH